MTRLIPDWEIRITNFGLGYILMCLIVAIAATNTGNNGLYVALSGMLAAMTVSGVLSRRNVRGVSCEIEPIDEVVATRPALLRVRFENRLRTGTAQALFFLHEGLPGPLWVDPLKAGEKREIVVEGCFPRRGVVRLPDAGLLSRFPMGLFRKYRRASLAREIVVFPCPEPSRVPEAPPEDARGGRPHASRRGGGFDIRTVGPQDPLTGCEGRLFEDVADPLDLRAAQVGEEGERRQECDGVLRHAAMVAPRRRVPFWP